MQPSSRQIKNIALESLKGKWALAIAAVALPFMAFIILLTLIELLCSLAGTALLKSVFAFLAAILWIFVIAPMFLGVIRFFSALVLERKLTLSEVFVYFSCKELYLRAVAATVHFTFRMSLLAVVLFLPSVCVDFVAGGGIDALFGGAPPIWFDSLWIVSIFLRGIAVALLTIIALRYYMFPFIYATDDIRDVSEALSLSLRVTSFGFSSFVGMIFSLFGWIALSLLVLPMLFTLPYILSCYAAHCACAAKLYNKMVNRRGATTEREDEFEFEI